MNRQAPEVARLFEENETLRRRVAELEEDLRQQNDSLRRRSSDLTIVMDGFPGLVCYKDTENRFLRVNRVIAEAHLKSKEELEGKSLFDLYPAETAQAYWDDDLEVIRTRRAKLNVEEPWETESGMRWVNTNKIPYIDATGEVAGVIAFSLDITESRKVRDELRRQVAVVEAINLLFEETLGKGTEEEMARTCLAVAEKLTGSAFGIIDEVNEKGLADSIAVSNPGWDACRMSGSEATMLLRDLPIRSYWGRVLSTGETQVVNDPSSDPDQRGLPDGHPTLTCFLGVPLKRAGETFGLIGLANRDRGYSDKERETVEALSSAFALVLEHKRAQTELQRHRDHLQELVEQRTRALETTVQQLGQSNQELEQFAYVASHDLQEPLRMVSSYTQLLARRYQDQLDQDAKEFIAYAVDGANRMQRLIQDLLFYSRVTSRGREMEPVDAHEALGEAVRNLQTAIQETAALVTNDDLPRVLGDPIQVAQVFQNLIGNALKFHRPEEAPRVHVSAQPNPDRPGWWTLSVKDNGIGIEARHFDRLFMVFHRLHGRQEYPGTGIGLALCKRIVERHGGTIWLESEPGRGTTFLFTLPAADTTKG